MALDWARVSLRGHGGAEPTGTALFEVLGLRPEDGLDSHPSDSAWKSANITLVEVARDDCQEADEPTEEFARRLDEGLRRAAAWIEMRPPGAFDRWRETGRRADVFVGGWQDGDQFDFSFPPEFLLACGRAGLPIEICTND
jgi:hypothetical protein